MDYVFEASDITKKFNGKIAVSGINLKLLNGSTVGIIGKNGAGKTTFIKIALGFLLPTSGNITIFGGLPGRFPGRVGYLSERSEYHICFTGNEYLKHIAAISGINKSKINSYAAELIELVGLTDSADKKMSRYSKGMLQRIGIAQAMITSPDFLILDEPFSGLDPSGQKELCNIISNLKSMKKTILVCSHILSHLEKICEDIAILHKGKIICHGQAKSLLTQKNNFKLELGNMNAELFKKLKNDFNIIDKGRGVYIFEECKQGEKETLLKAVLNNGILVNEFSLVKQTLDDYFNDVILKIDGE